MDQTKLCEGEMPAANGIEVPPKEESAVNSWVTRVILVTLQIVVALSIFQMFRDIIFAHSSAANSNLYLGILGCTLATICACLLLLKYQKLIQQFCRDNVQLGERLGARTYALEKANEEMRLEIAERERVEKALMESESRFRTIIREAALGIALIDRHGRVIEGNPALSGMLGYGAGELQGMEFTRINHPEDAASSWENFRQLLTGGQDICRVETRYIRKDGWIGWDGNRSHWCGSPAANPSLPSLCSRTLPNGIDLTGAGARRQTPVCHRFVRGHYRTAGERRKDSHLPATVAIPGLGAVHNRRTGTAPIGHGAPRPNRPAAGSGQGQIRENSGIDAVSQPCQAHGRNPAAD